jgi:hypothetical protein
MVLEEKIEDIQFFVVAKAQDVVFDATVHMYIESWDSMSLHFPASKGSTQARITMNKVDAERELRASSWSKSGTIRRRQEINWTIRLECSMTLRHAGHPTQEETGSLTAELRRAS